MYEDVEPGLVPLTIFAYVISLLAAVPVWLVAAQRLGKVKAWRVSVRLQIVAYAVTAAAMNPIFFGFPDRVRILFGFVLAAVVGATNSATITIAFSLQGDIIDMNALTTGETGVPHTSWWDGAPTCAHTLRVVEGARSLLYMRLGSHSPRARACALPLTAGS